MRDPIPSAPAPEPQIIAQLRQRLFALGCPAKAARRIVAETAEHLDDLRAAALARGLDSSAAIHEAESLLGDPATLAQEHVLRLRQTSLWTRQPMLTFVVLPAVVAPMPWCLWMFITDAQTAFPDIGGIGGFFGWYVALIIGSWLATALITSLFAWLSRSMAVAREWSWASGAVISIHAMLLQFQNGRASFTTDGFAPSSQAPLEFILGVAAFGALACLGPIVLAVLCWWRSRRSQNIYSRWIWFVSCCLALALILAQIVLTVGVLVYSPIGLNARIDAGEPMFVYSFSLPVHALDSLMDPSFILWLGNVVIPWGIIAWARKRERRAMAAFDNIAPLTEVHHV